MKSIPPEQLHLQLTDPIAETEAARQVALGQTMKANKELAYAGGCVLSVLGIITAFVWLIHLSTDNETDEGSGVDYFPYFFLVGIPVILLMGFVGSWLLFGKKAKAPLTIEEYRAYQRVWVNKLLSGWLAAHSPDIRVHHECDFAKQLEGKMWYFYSRNDTHRYHPVGNIQYSAAGVTLSVDLLTIRRLTDKPQQFVFSGLVIRVPFQQIFANKTMYAYTKRYRAGWEKKLTAFNPKDISEHTPIYSHLELYTEDNLHAEDLLYSGWIEWVDTLAQHPNLSFVGLVAHQHEVFIWLGYKESLFNPSIEQAVWDSVAPAAWREVLGWLEHCAELAARRK